MSESKTQCPLCHNFENHQAGCRIGTLELELNEARSQAELWASRASGYVNDEQTYGTHRELYDQLTTAQQEISELKKDKERLTRLESLMECHSNQPEPDSDNWIWMRAPSTNKDLRQAIDSAIKGTNSK